MDRKRKQSDNPSNADASSGGGAEYNWREGLAPSLRVLNRARLAVVIQGNPREIRMDAPWILERARLEEERLYQQATNEHDYLTRVCEYIQRIPHSQGDLGVRERMLQQLNLKSGKNVVMPELNQPYFSKKQKGKQPEAQGSTNSPTTGNHEPSNSIKSLLERHGDATLCLQRLVLLFQGMLDLAQRQQDVSAGRPVMMSDNPMARMSAQWQLQYSELQRRIWQRTVFMHQKTAGVDFVNGLMELDTLLKIMLEEMAHAEGQGQYQVMLVHSYLSRYLYPQMNSLEEWYEAKILELIKTYSMCINYKLEGLNQEMLNMYQQYLLSLDFGKKYRNTKNQAEVQNPGRGASFRLANLTSLVGYSQQSQYLGLRPVSTPVHLTSHMGQTERQNPGGECSNIGVSSAAVHLTSQTGYSESQYLGGVRSDVVPSAAPVGSTSQNAVPCSATIESTSHMRYSEQQQRLDAAAGPSFVPVDFTSQMGHSENHLAYIEKDLLEINQHPLLEPGQQPQAGILPPQQNPQQQLLGPNEESGNLSDDAEFWQDLAKGQ